MIQVIIVYGINLVKILIKGATLAHLGKPDEAMQAYHKALDLKPNYVRVWVNLGIAHAYKSNYMDASKFYLNALSFNPSAEHLWNYL